VQGVLGSNLTVSSLRIFVVIYHQDPANLGEDKRFLKYNVYCTYIVASQTLKSFQFYRISCT
jgi:hypothetical protein